MPNHVTNILTVHGDRASEILEKINGTWDDGTERLMDFNKIIPMPEEMNLEVPYADEKLAVDLFHSGERPSEKHSQSVHKLFSNLKKHGYAYWYSWARAKWGTKWNAYSPERKDDRTIKFETAWSTPMPVWKALSKAFPDTVFEVKYADEDIGHNCGHFEVKDGEVFDKLPDLEMGTSESEAFAYAVTGREPYKDDEEDELPQSDTGTEKEG